MGRGDEDSGGRPRPPSCTPLGQGAAFTKSFAGARARKSERSLNGAEIGPPPSPLGRLSGRQTRGPGRCVLAGRQRGVANQCTSTTRVSADSPPFFFGFSLPTRRPRSGLRNGRITTAALPGAAAGAWAAARGAGGRLRPGAGSQSCQWWAPACTPSVSRQRSVGGAPVCRACGGVLA